MRERGKIIVADNPWHLAAEAQRQGVLDADAINAFLDRLPFPGGAANSQEPTDA